MEYFEAKSSENDALYVRWTCVWLRVRVVCAGLGSDPPVTMKPRKISDPLQPEGLKHNMGTRRKTLIHS